MIKHRLNQSEMKKYIELGTLDVKIGPFSRSLGLETLSLRFKIQNFKIEVSRPKILENGPILTSRVPNSMYIFISD